jgi:hypothetical protein
MNYEVSDASFFHYPTFRSYKDFYGQLPLHIVEKLIWDTLDLTNFNYLTHIFASQLFTPARQNILRKIAERIRRHPSFQRRELCLTLPFEHFTRVFRDLTCLRRSPSAIVAHTRFWVIFSRYFGTPLLYKIHQMLQLLDRTINFEATLMFRVDYNILTDLITIQLVGINGSLFECMSQDIMDNSQCICKPFHPYWGPGLISRASLTT